MNAIREFYSKLQFPGPYTIEHLASYDEHCINPFLSQIDKSLSSAASVIDLGCGSGFITNFLARRHPQISFTAIDFSDSIEYASNFAARYGIKNVTWIKHDITQLSVTGQFDTVLCIGVLHHIPDYHKAVQKIDDLLAPNSRLCLGVYNWLGHNMCKIFPVKFRCEILRADQQDAPFAESWSDQQVRLMFGTYEIEKIYPGLANRAVDLCNLTNASNGGLTLYTFSKSCS